jgi:septum formation topological specificity factor MinE
MARRDGELVGGITAFADGPDEMREVIREHVEIGVDNIKLSMSGEEVGCSVLSSERLSLISHRSRKSAQRKTAISQMKRRQPVLTRPTGWASAFVPMPEPGIPSPCVSSTTIEQ